MADYLIIWVDHALQQYLALEPHASTQVTEQLGQLARDPKTSAQYDAGTDRWSITFDSGRGLVVYIVNDENRRVVILRILHVS